MIAAAPRPSAPKTEPRAARDPDPVDHDPPEAACAEPDETADVNRPADGDDANIDMGQQPEVENDAEKQEIVAPGNEDAEMMTMAVHEAHECLNLIANMGCSTRSYRRERRRGFNKIVSEIYSPPRVTRMLSSMPGHELVPGLALDVTCNDPDDGKPWDFDCPEKREKARVGCCGSRSLCSSSDHPCAQLGAHGRGSTRRSETLDSFSGRWSELGCTLTS